MFDDIDALKAEEKKQEAAGRSRERSWFPGLILIIAGLYFLGDSLFNFELIENWWALFLLIPAFANLRCAWRNYRATGQFGGPALTKGLLIMTIGLIFLFGLNFGLYWPLLLIILGASILLRDEHPKPVL